MQEFDVEHLPYPDQRAIKRGRCPWCDTRILPIDNHDTCPTCGDRFVGKLSAEVLD